MWTFVGHCYTLARAWPTVAAVPFSSIENPKVATLAMSGYGCEDYWAARSTAELDGLVVVMHDCYTERASEEFGRTEKKSYEKIHQG